MNRYVVCRIVPYSNDDRLYTKVLDQAEFEAANEDAAIGMWACSLGYDSLDDMLARNPGFDVSEVTAVLMARST